MPAEYKKWKQAVADFLKEQNVRIGSTPVEVMIACYVKRPRTSKLDFPKPDVDNYAKSVLDAATDAGVWDDDTQVKSLTVHKDWHNCLDPFSEGEGIVFHIREL